MILESGNSKVVLKSIEKSDLDDLHALRTNPEVSKYILKRDIHLPVAETEKLLERVMTDPTGFLFSIRTVSDNCFAGTICLWNINFGKKYAELGYELLPEHQGKGIMSAAMSEMLKFAFAELQFETLEAFTHRENKRSIKLLEKFSFQLVEGKRDPDFPFNVIYCLNKP